MVVAPLHGYNYFLNAPVASGLHILREAGAYVGLHAALSTAFQEECWVFPFFKLNTTIAWGPRALHCTATTPASKETNVNHV